MIIDKRQFSSKRKLYIDLDDTLLDTEVYLRQVLANQGIKVNEDISVYQLRDSGIALDIIESAMDNYFSIPWKSGAEVFLHKSLNEFDVNICSVYKSDRELESKIKFLSYMEMLKVGYALCSKGKGELDMSDAVLIDDRISELNSSNALSKYCMYNAYQSYTDLEYSKFEGKIVRGFHELIM